MSPEINPSILKAICPIPIKFSHTQFLPSNIVQHWAFLKQVKVMPLLVNKKLDNPDFITSLQPQVCMIFHSYPLNILFMVVTARIVSGLSSRDTHWLELWWKWQLVSVGHLLLLIKHKIGSKPKLILLQNVSWYLPHSWKNYPGSFLYSHHTHTIASQLVCLQPSRS